MYFLGKICLPTFCILSKEQIFFLYSMVYINKTLVKLMNLYEAIGLKFITNTLHYFHKKLLPSKGIHFPKL